MAAGSVVESVREPLAATREIPAPDSALASAPVPVLALALALAEGACWTASAG
ncbi:hypothetical protein [Streptomyces sp. V2I9]|uniref:hypothetical protein n=1 Tax=Streptomyces sp. V2I9 TaxID=3042304 RepID=UPI002780EAE9|nr:hypothetical protein [Streptomyces sp. V2I9]MDQ0986182.1 hypothetical protein [Streptomyces sp. V2I9]